MHISVIILSEIFSTFFSTNINRSCVECLCREGAYCDITAEKSIANSLRTSETGKVIDFNSMFSLTLWPKLVAWLVTDL